MVLVRVFENLSALGLAVDVVRVDPVPGEHRLVVLLHFGRSTPLRRGNSRQVQVCVLLQPVETRADADVVPFLVGDETSQVGVQQVLLLTGQLVAAHVDVRLTARVVVRQVDAHSCFYLKILVNYICEFCVLENIKNPKENNLQTFGSMVRLIV